MAVQMKVSEYRAQLNAFLRSNADTGIKKYLAMAEEKTKVDREFLVYGFLGLYLAYLIVGSGAQLACNLVAFSYPAYESLKALRTARKDDDTQWLTYWTVFGAFSVVDFFSSKIMAYFPIYWAAKIVFLIYLFHGEARGAEEIWWKVLRPLAMRVGLGSRAQSTGSVARRDKFSEKGRVVAPAAPAGEEVKDSSGTAQDERKGTQASDEGAPGGQDDQYEYRWVQQEVEVEEGADGATEGDTQREEGSIQQAD